jgi:F0F1-type ATP synthase delta subunit
MPSGQEIVDNFMKATSLVEDPYVKSVISQMSEDQRYNYLRQIIHEYINFNFLAIA